MSPVVGSFVFEQVRALRRFEDVEIEVVSPTPFWPGSRRHPRSYAASRRRFTGVLAEATRRAYDLDGITVRYLPYFVPHAVAMHGDEVNRRLKAFDEILRRFDPHIVHAHSGYVDGFGGSQLARRLDVPLILTEHTGPFSRLVEHHHVRRRVQEAYSSAACVLAVSAHQRHQIVKALGEDLEPKVEVVPNGYDTDVFRPSPHERPARPLTLLYVGFVTPGKGLTTLIEAFELLSRSIPDCRLLIQGDVADPNELDDVLWEARRRGLDDRIVRIGGGNREQVAATMRLAADVLVLPSEGETFGCVVVEALGSGLPVVVTRCGGPQDIVAGEPAARMCEVGDAAGMADAVLDLWRARLRGDIDGRAMADRTQHRFGYRVVAARVADRYRTLTRQGV